MESIEAGHYWEANAETWTRHVRAGYDVYRDRLNTPSFLAMLPPVAGLTGLDLGCGEGENTRKLARMGARMCAVDVAPTFIRHAQAVEDIESLGIAYRVADAQALPFADGAFDFATAFMSLMDMPAADRALCESVRVLRPGGFLQFSILHPCFVPPHRRVLREADGSVRAVEVARYFDPCEGEVETWWFSTLPETERATTEPFRVPRFHRTLSRWVEMVVQAGLTLETMAEPSASAELGTAEPVLADTRVVPLFLHVRVRKV